MFVFSSITLVNTEIFVVVIVCHLFKIMQNEKKKKKKGEQPEANRKF